MWDRQKKNKGAGDRQWVYFKSRVFVCQRERRKWEIERGPYGCEHLFVPAGPEAMLKLGLLSFSASLVVIVHLTFRFSAPYFRIIHFTALCSRLSFFFLYTFDSHGFKRFASIHSWSWGPGTLAWSVQRSETFWFESRLRVALRRQKRICV